METAARSVIPEHDDMTGSELRSSYPTELSTGDSLPLLRKLQRPAIFSMEVALLAQLRQMRSCPLRIMFRMACGIWYVAR
jgi:hypothetical protein